MKPSNEWAALDVAKFFCVLVMVFVHTALALITNADEGVNVASPVYPLWQQLAWLGLFPLAIPATAGAGLRLSWEKYWKGARIEGYRLATILRVSVAITLLGFLMNFLAWGAGEAFQWDVLQFMGVSFLVITLLVTRANAYSVYALGSFTLAVTPWLRPYLTARENWATILLVGSPIKDGYWPFFPWFFAVAFGFGVADLRQRLPKRAAFLPALAAAGVAGVAAAAATGNWGLEIDPGHLWGGTVFRPTAFFMIGLAGFFCLLLVAGEAIASRMAFARYGWVNSFSKGVLWIYLFHVTLADRLGEWLSPRFPPGWAAFFYPGAMALACWGVGAFSLYLGGKRVKVVLAKAA